MRFFAAAATTFTLAAYLQVGPVLVQAIPARSLVADMGSESRLPRHLYTKRSPEDGDDGGSGGNQATSDPVRMLAGLFSYAKGVGRDAPVSVQELAGSDQNAGLPMLFTTGGEPEKTTKRKRSVPPNNEHVFDGGMSDITKMKDAVQGAEQNARTAITKAEERFKQSADKQVARPQEPTHGRGGSNTSTAPPLETAKEPAPPALDTEPRDDV